MKAESQRMLEFQQKDNYNARVEEKNQKVAKVN